MSLRYRFEVPARYAEASVEDYQPRTDAQQRARDAVVDFLSLDSERGVIFAGPPGTGKTLLLSLVANEAHPSSAFITMARYERLLRKRMTAEGAYRSAPRDEVIVAEYERLSDIVAFLQERVHVLCLDDLGKEHTTQTQWIEDEVDYLLRRRFDVGVPTCITTNYTPSQFAVKYSDSMASFIREAYSLVKVDGPDQRMDQ